MADRPPGASARFTRWTLLPPLLALLGGYGLWLGAPSALRMAGGASHADTALYQAIQGRVARGQSYHAAAAVEHRRRGYPLRPFVAVRPPALALFVTAVGGAGAALWWLRGLSLLTVVATAAALRRDGLPRASRLVAVGPLALSLLAFAQPALLWWHELWAGLLAWLALVSRRPGRWGVSVGAGLAAVMVREFALLLPVVMAGWALVERQRREALAWLLVLLAGGMALAAHAMALFAVLRPGDARSPGWVAVGGWRFVLGAARSGTLLILLPPWLPALIVPVSLAGLASWRGPTGRRVVSVLLGWMAAFTVLGRADNGYWGLMFGPALTVGSGLALVGAGGWAAVKRATTNRSTAL